MDCRAALAMTVTVTVAITVTVAGGGTVVIARPQAVAIYYLQMLLF